MKTPVGINAPVRLPWWVGATHTTLFLLGSALWMLLLSVGYALVSTTPAQEMETLSFAILSILQITGFAAVAIALVVWLPRDTPGLLAMDAPITDKLTGGLALGAAPPGLLGLAFTGSLTVWTLPSWIAETLSRLSGQDAQSLQLIASALRDANPVGQGLMIFAVLVCAPVCEELIFRGYLWGLFERSANRRMAFMATTLLFALYHIDPIHVVALLPTALFLSWLRYMSGSLWPGVVAHLGNNLVATAVVLLQPEDTQASLPFPASLAGALFTLWCCVAAYRQFRRP